MTRRRDIMRAIFADLSQRAEITPDLIRKVRRLSEMRKRVNAQMGGRRG